MPELALEEFGRILADSFRSLYDFRMKFQSRKFSSPDCAAKELSLSWDPKFIPNFEFDKGRMIKARQEPYFTVFVFAEALSEFLMGLEEIAAYEVLEHADYDQFANFASYTACFHLVDSFLCLSGIYYIWNPIADCDWRLLRKTTDPRTNRSVPIHQLEPIPFSAQGGPNAILARWSNNVHNPWLLQASSSRTVHVQRWRFFGEELKRILNTQGLDALPLKVRQFFGYFSSYLAYLRLENEDFNSVEGLKSLIDISCLGINADGVTRPPLIPQLRSFAVYRNQSLDEHLRLIGPTLDPSIVDSPAKLIGRHFNRLANGLAEWQAERLAMVLEKASEILGSDAVRNGVRSAFLFCGLVELDFSKVIKSQLYDILHPAIRDAIAPIFRDARYIIMRPQLEHWNVGSSERPDFHIFRIPITIPDVLTLGTDWFPHAPDDGVTGR